MVSVIEYLILVYNGHTQGNRTASRGETSKPTADDDRPEIGRQSAGNLPDVDQEETQLEDLPSPELLGPRRPQLAAKGIANQKDHLACPSGLSGDPKTYG